MSKQENSTPNLLEQRALLQAKEELATMPLSNLLDLASSATEVLGAMALEAEKAGNWQEATALCAELAAAWQGVADVVPADVRSHLLTVAAYWAERAAEARQRAQNLRLEYPARVQATPPTFRKKEFLPTDASKKFHLDFALSRVDEAKVFTRRGGRTFSQPKESRALFERPAHHDLKKPSQQEDHKDEET
jgi:hypothetical protein